MYEEQKEELEKYKHYEKITKNQIRDLEHYIKIQKIYLKIFANIDDIEVVGDMTNPEEIRLKYSENKKMEIAKGLFVWSSPYDTTKYNNLINKINKEKKWCEELIRDFNFIGNTDCEEYKRCKHVLEFIKRIEESEE